MRNFIILFLGPLLMMGCSKVTTSAIIEATQKDAFRSYITEQNETLKEYKSARNFGKNAICLNQIINTIVQENVDTIFVLEKLLSSTCEYQSIVWNRHEKWEVSKGAVLNITNKSFNVTDNVNMNMVALWDIERTKKMAHKYPFVYQDSRIRYWLATRLIFKHKKCVKAQTFAFEPIDPNCKIGVTNFD